MWSSVPWMTSTGQRRPAAGAPRPPLRSRRPTSNRVSRSASRRRVEAPGDAVLDLLGRVRLGEHLAEEELEEAAVVAAASSAGCTSPSPRRSRARRRTGTRRARDRAGRGTGSWADEDGRPERALGVPRREQQPRRGRRARARRRTRCSMPAASSTATASAANSMRVVRAASRPGGPRARCRGRRT